MLYIEDTLGLHRGLNSLKRPNFGFIRGCGYRE
ncbi:TPA_asm: hypothetical protein [Porphyromonas phage phage012a_381OKJP]|uniref:Uncharacterized protein n=1 Tax=Porphyromonas phage phage012a_381OKJP TaxID=3154102 RepID=A0AAT9JCP9_9CAUD